MSEREDLTARVIALSARLLSEEGPEALTVRRIAQESDASTQLIYTLFGGKVGLLDGLYREGFHRLRCFMHDRQDPADCRRNLESLLRCYREFASQHRPFFLVMFTRPFFDFTPSSDSMQIAWNSFSVIIEAVTKCQAQGDLPGDATFIARQLWSRIHGVVTLEIIGHLWDQSSDQIYDSILQDLWRR